MVQTTTGSNRHRPSQRLKSFLFNPVVNWNFFSSQRSLKEVAVAVTQCATNPNPLPLRANTPTFRPLGYKIHIFVLKTTRQIQCCFPTQTEYVLRIFLSSTKFQDKRCKVYVRMTFCRLAQDPVARILVSNIPRECFA